MNSFAMFDLDHSLAAVASELLRELPEQIRVAIGQIRTQTRGRLKPPPERWADYLGIVRDDPTLLTAGRELWRVGMIPDVGGEGLLERLANNRRCVLALAYPARPQTSPVERLDTVGLRHGGVRDELRSFLEGKRLVSEAN